MSTRHLVITGAASVALSLGLCAAAWTFWLKPPTLVTFDLKGTMNAFIRQSAKMPLDDDQRHQLLSRFDKSLTTVTAQYAEAHNAGVLVSAAAVSGLPDATPEIQARLAEAMKGSAGGG